MWSLHFLCHISLGNYPSPHFPSMHPLSLKRRLSYLMFKTQNSYCKLKCLTATSHYQVNSLPISASLHVQHQSMRFVFGRIHLLVMCLGVASDPDFQLGGSLGHPLQPQSCVRAQMGSSCCVQTIPQALCPPKNPFICMENI
jgi:hypothetical protein